MGVQPSIRHIGKYEVIDVIGTGGMGIVFRAQDPAIGRTVAIKMLRQADPSAGTGLFDRFFSREMKSTGNLHHKNIVTVYDSGEQDGNPYLVMEYLEGDAISKAIAERRPIPLVEKLDVVAQVCDGLQYAHDRNIIHRDIKPANVILLADGTAKIVDFGVARIAGGESTIVQAGQLVGSLYYLSPEQINSLPIDARSDIFSTGVLLYEFLTGELPFKGSDPATTFVKILTEEPPPLSRFLSDVPPALQTVVSRALTKNVNDRYQTAEELGFEILSVQKHLTSGIIADCMKRAEAAAQRHDLERARQHLLEVVRLDRQHERANRLLRDVRKAIQQEQRSSQIVQMRSQAQVALAGGQYEEALACADQALKLDPSDRESVRLSEEIRAAITRARAVREALNRAESALFAGDFDEAKDAVEESLRLDPSDSEARALSSVVNKELAERSRRQRVQEFVDQARRGIAERNFGEAVDALHNAEKLDPADSNIRELLQWAERGQEQEKRRRYLQEITDQIEKALRNGDFSSACTISEMGLQRFPDDPTLGRLRAISEKQRDIAERRRFVQDQSLAVKILTDQGRLAEAIETLSLALKKYPGEPNLESLLALTRTEADRLRLEREEAARREERQRAEEEARTQLAQRVLNASIELRRSLDSRTSLDKISAEAAKLRTAIETPDLDEHAKNAAVLVLQEVDARLQAHDQAVTELEQLRQQIEHVQDVASLADGDNRVRSIRTAFPGEKRIQSLCSEISSALSRLREEHDHRISLLASLAQRVESTPAGVLAALREKADELGAGFAEDARIGVLLQQIESLVSARLDARAAHHRDLENLSTDLSRSRSLQDISRIVERARSIAALDRTDDELAARATNLQTEAARSRTFLESLLSEMNGLSDRVAGAATVDDAEAVTPQIHSLAGRQPDFQELQEAATRLLAQVHGRRIEHDLIVQELESLRATLLTLEAEEDLSAAAARAAECRSLHRQDPTILALSGEIETTVERILHQRDELSRRDAACDAAIGAADGLLTANNPVAALETLLSVEADSPERTDLHQKIVAVQKQLERIRIEQERLEQERIAREKAEAEVRERAAAAQQSLQKAQGLLAEGRAEESIRVLRGALERDPGHNGLHATLQAAETELAHRRAEAERVEQERIARENERLATEKAEAERKEQERRAKEKAEAEARTREAAARQAVTQAQQLSAQGKATDALLVLRDALGRAQHNQVLLSELTSIEGELARQRAEQERAERERIAREKAEAQRKEQERLAREKAESERLERERIARQKAEAERLEQERILKEKAAEEARARQTATEQAIRQARQFLAQAKGEESLAILLAAIERDPASASLRTALDSTRKELARQQAELERLAKEKADHQRRQEERLAREKAAAEQKERQRLAKEKADAEKQEKDRLAREQAERERLARKEADRERRERERLAKAKVAAEAQARLAASEQAQEKISSTAPEVSPAAPSMQPAASASVPLFRRPSIVVGASAALLVLVAGAWFAVRTIVSPVPTVPVNFSITPAGAALTIDGQHRPCTAHCTVQLQPGKHSIALAQNGYAALNRNLTVAKADANSTVNLALEAAAGAPLPGPHPLAGSSLAILGDIGAAGVSLDGKPAGDLATGHLDLDQLAPGNHRLVVTRGGKDLRLSVRVAAKGSVTIDNAAGLDDNFVLAAMHSAEGNTLFCRCGGSELQIDGKDLKPFARNLYRLPAATPDFSVTLLHGGRSQNVVLRVGSPNQATLLVTPAALSPTPAPQLVQQQTPSTVAADQQAQNQPANVPQPPVQTASAQPTTPPRAPAPQTLPAPAPAPTPVPAPDLTAWNTIRNSVQISDFQQFVKTYPDSPHAPEARQHIAALQEKLDQQQKEKLQADEQQIRATLEAYQTAYRAKDLNGMLAVFPTMPDRSDYQKTFKVADQVKVTITPSTLTINGDHATVSVLQQLVLVVHGKTAFQKSVTIPFTLEKNQGRWLITSTQ